MSKRFLEEKVTLRFFKIEEFDSPDEKGSGVNMRVSTLEKLDRAREYAGVPFKINSGYRTRAHNDRLKNAAKNSAHLEGYAVDIAAPTEEVKMRIIWGCVKAGFKRIGVGERFVHVDDDPTKKSPSVWTYDGYKLKVNPFSLKITDKDNETQK